MKITKQAIRFYGHQGGQINAHWSLLNIFAEPRRAAFKRVRNFFRNIRYGIQLERL